MRNALIMFMVFMFMNTLSYSQTLSNQTEEKIRQNALKKLVEWEIDKTLSTMSYNMDPKIFSREEQRKLAAGKTVEKKNLLFPVLSDFFPFIRLRDVILVDYYYNDNCRVKGVSSRREFGEAKITFPLSLISFFLPLLLVLLLPINGFGRNKSVKIRITLFIILSDLFVLVSFAAAIIVSVFTTDILFSLPIIILLLLTIFGKQQLLEKMIIISGLIVGTFVGVYAGRFMMLGFPIFSSEFLKIWQYSGLYVLIGMVMITIMWLTRTSESWRETVFAVSDIEDDED